jgi:L-threonylcarbamoyladenylate synthase
MQAGFIEHGHRGLEKLANLGDPEMKTEVLPIHPDKPEAEPIARAAAVLRSGGLVAFPTETVYGLGANALDAAAVARIFAAKGRPAANPMIVHVADVESARALARAWPEPATTLARQFWPGPLTLVVKKAGCVPDVVSAGGDTVALRMPAHPVALALLRVTGLPLAAPSANRSSRLSPTRAEHVLADLEGRIDLLLDAGPTRGGLESTVLDVTVMPPQLLRPGLIGPALIEAVVGPVIRPESFSPLRNQAARSPGMLGKHYAPQTPTELGPGDGRERVLELHNQGRRVGWLAFTGMKWKFPADIRIIEMPCEPVAYAAQLYAALHDLDAAGLDRIVVASPPEGEEWLAIRDRLHRAVAP